MISIVTLINITQVRGLTVQQPTQHIVRFPPSSCSVPAALSVVSTKRLLHFKYKIYRPLRAICFRVRVAWAAVPVVPGPFINSFTGHGGSHGRRGSGRGAQGHGARAAGCSGTTGDVAAGSRGSARTAVTVNECSIQPFLPQPTHLWKFNCMS